MRKKSNRSMIITATVLSALLFCFCGKVDDVPAQESTVKVENEMDAEPVSEQQTIDEVRELIASLDATSDNEQDMDILLQCYVELRKREAVYCKIKLPKYIFLKPVALLSICHSFQKRLNEFGRSITAYFNRYIIRFNGCHCLRAGQLGTLYLSN